MKKLFVMVAVLLIVSPAWATKYLSNSDWTQPFVSDAYTRALWHLDEVSGTVAPVADAATLYNSPGTLDTNATNGWGNTPDAELDPNLTWVGSMAGFGNAAKAWYTSSTDQNMGAITFPNIYANNNPLSFAENDFTIEFWMNPMDVGGGWGSRIVKNYTGGDFAVNYGSTAQKLDFQWYGGGWQGVTSTYLMPLNAWTHVAITVDRTSSETLDTITFFYNGVLFETFTGPAGGSWYAYDTEVSLFNDGVWAGPLYPPRQFSGMIDEVRLSDAIRYVPEPGTLSLLAVGLLALLKKK